MTTLTGSTPKTLAGTREPPTFGLAMSGACSQLLAAGYVWGAHTTAGQCMSRPIECLSDVRQADPWGRQVVATGLMALGVWLVSIVPLVLGRSGHSNPSPVDCLWSLQPWAYCWHFLLSSREPSARLVLMTGLATLWGVRLTYNFYIKGGFSGGEDYRWKEVRTWFPGWKYEVFNLVFISTFQQFLILAFTVPAVAALQSNEPLGLLDAVAAGLFLLFLLGEALADHQQFEFQTEKYRLKGAGLSLSGTPYEQGFIDTGVWAFSRHPNYFCEVALWWSFYLFSVPATGAWLNWTVLGAAFLTGLFVPPGASVDVTESLASRKYKAYAGYQARVSRFVPWFPSSAQGTGAKES